MRLFIAIAFPDKIKDRLKAGIDDLRRQGDRASWSRRENLHLTLEFLGELDSAKEAIAAMEQVQAAPFRLEFAPSGRFRRREGDIFWLGIRPNEGLMELQKQLHHALQAQGLQLESRPYRPHLTLARHLRDQGEIMFPEPLPPAVLVSEFVLMLSQRTPKGMRYIRLHRRKLEG